LSVNPAGGYRNVTAFLPAPDATAARKKMASIMNDMSVTEAFTVCISNISMLS
jgi:hypothetical protein